MTNTQIIFQSGVILWKHLQDIFLSSFSVEHWHIKVETGVEVVTRKSWCVAYLNKERKSSIEEVVNIRSGVWSHPRGV